MQSAYLYIRVSTDEQAVKGYSQRSQLDRLVRYCIAHDITVLRTVFEDHSAKTFDRPAWSNMILGLKHAKSNRPSLILFTKWDRFSRNAGEAYYVIKQLKHLNVEPQAIDQPLDLSIPENKIILAVYLSASEVENDRRSLNVKQGMHKAKQEGRWIAHAPLGYCYKLSAAGKKYIGPKEPEATVVRNAFNLVGEGQLNIRSAYKQMIESSLQCSLSQFWRMLRNPVYCGKVLVPAFENDKAYLAIGAHEPLITETLFAKVKDILERRSRMPQTGHNLDERLILRGFLYCPRCNSKLTGSISKGRHNRYCYYHCNSSCGFRINADKINKLLYEKIEKLTAGDAYVDLYKSILKYKKQDLSARTIINQESISRNIDQVIDRVIKAKELLIRNEIESDDFLLIKNDCEERIRLMGIELQRSSSAEKIRAKLLDKLTMELSQLTVLIQRLSFMEKRSLFTLILSNKIILNDKFDFGCWFNSAMQTIYNLNYSILGAYRKPGREISHDNYLKEVTSKIIAIEEKKGKKINFKSAQYIAHFLVNLAAIAIQK